MAKKFLSALLAVLMIVGMVPMAAMADVAEYEPTLAVGVSESESKAKEDAGKAVGATISSDVGQAKNILWFAMTGLGTGSKYSLSVKNANGDEFGPICVELIDTLRNLSEMETPHYYNVF